MKIRIFSEVIREDVDRERLEEDVNEFLQRVVPDIGKVEWLQTPVGDYTQLTAVITYTV